MGEVTIPTRNIVIYAVGFVASFVGFLFFTHDDWEDGGDLFAGLGCLFGLISAFFVALTWPISLPLIAISSMRMRVEDRKARQDQAEQTARQYGKFFAEHSFEKDDSEPHS